MNSVETALWFVESHFASDITLEEIAAIAGVSRHHMVRAFGAATGRSVMRYLRGRRLSEAARSLVRAQFSAEARLREILAIYQRKML